MVISYFILIFILIMLFLVGQYMVYIEFNNIDVGTKIVVFKNYNDYVYDEVIEVNRQYHYIVTKQRYKFYYIDLLRNQFCLEEDFE